VDDGTTVYESDFAYDYHATYVQGPEYCAASRDADEHLCMHCPRCAFRFVMAVAS
jgi:hypothetical protein